MNGLNSSAEVEAGAALKASTAINKEQQMLTEESRLLLVAMLREEMKDAVREGIAGAMTDEAAERFWSKGLEVLQRQAKQKAGGFLLEGVTTALKKLLWIAVFVAVAYSIGGWTLLKAVWAAIKG